MVERSGSVDRQAGGRAEKLCDRIRSRNRLMMGNAWCWFEVFPWSERTHLGSGHWSDGGYGVLWIFHGCIS